MSEEITSRSSPFDSPENVRARLAEIDYIAGGSLSTVLYLAISMRRPLFLEGEPGSGKTELAKAIAQITGGELLRLQCYEGIDSTQALYEWDYARQLLHLRVQGQNGSARQVDERELYTEEFLLRRPLLRALSAPVGIAPPVLLIDEVDRADDEFEAFLLEALSDYAVSVPELGTVRAVNPPIVILTSNRTRDVHDALKRRSLYHWLGQPSFEDEVAIVIARAPAVSPELATEVTAAVRVLRELGLYKPPGVAESIDWAVALAKLHHDHLDLDGVDATLGVVVKYREDLARVREAGLEVVFARTAP